MKKLLLITAVMLLLCISQTAHAELLSFTSISTNGSITNGAAVIDDSFPPEGQGWTINTAYWHGTESYIAFNLGQIYTIEDIILSVDNNDDYTILYTENWESSLSNWMTLATIYQRYGEIGGGMDTMSSVAGDAEYISQIDFSAVEAQYLLIRAIGGDDCYSVGEFDVYGSPVTSAVPEPASLALLGMGLTGFIFRRKK